MDANNNATKISPKSKSFSISAILSSNNGEGNLTALKRKRDDQENVVIGRQGVAKFMRLESLHNHVTVTLENRGLWEIFHDVGTEMVITKSGRRMFPALKVTVLGLDPALKYIVMMDVVPADNYRYKYHESEWLVTGKAYPDVPKSKRVHTHTESPNSGAKWMSSVISFHKVKITNNATASKSGQIVLNSLHKYQPRIHIMQAANFSEVTDEKTMVFVFPETSFMAVTAYQSEQITQLKIDNNPFAKGFRDPSPSDIERARLVNSVHYRIPVYPYGSPPSDTSIPPQGHCLRSQCVLPITTPNDAWFIQSQALPGLPQQTPFSVHVLPTSSEPPKRMKKICSPVCQCMNGELSHSYDADHQADHKFNEEITHMRPSPCTNVICACSSHFLPMLSPHTGHFSRVGSPDQPSGVIRNTINHGHKMHSCSCCFDHRQLQWVNKTGHKHVKPPVF